MRFKLLDGGGAFALLAALTLLTGCIFAPRPTHDPSTLKAIAAESRTLMAARPTPTYVTVPKSQWPPVIASLKPFDVTVFSYGVNIATKPYFDGGWGYFVPRREGELPKPTDRYSELGHDVYWYQDD